MTDQELLNKYHYHKLQLEHKKILDKSGVGYGLGKRLLAASAMIGAGVAGGALGYNVAEHYDLAPKLAGAVALAPMTAGVVATGLPLSNRLLGQHKTLDHGMVKRWHEKQMKKMEHKARLRGLKLE